MSIATAVPESLNVGDSVQTGFDQFFGYLPNIIGFIVIVVVTLLVAKIIRKVLDKVLERLNIDEAVDKTPAGKAVDKLSPGGKPSHLLGFLVYWFVVLFGLTAAFGALKIPAVTAFINEVLDYVPNIIVAIIIFVVAAILAGGVAGVVAKTMGDTPTGKLVATVVPGVILAIAGFMILTQLEIAPQIVVLTYGAIVGMLALAGALAFGLGGREVAAQILSNAYDKAGDVAGQAKQDAQVGKQRAQSTIIQRG